jgi:putative CocE/NonD family hydrolase
MTWRRNLVRAGGLLALTLCVLAAANPARAAKDYRVQEAMVPMRDGTRLFTVIVFPAKAHAAPMLLTRTPFGASSRLFKPEAGDVATLLGSFERPFVEDGYIRVFQDVRGRGRSEGDYVVTRPARGPLNLTRVDHATDAYDTIDWLVKHVPDSDGRVGLIGWSYDGFTSAMALLQPHPALKAAVIVDPMVDGWMGDDWFHHGAFRQSTLDFIAAMSGRNEAFDVLHPEHSDDYAASLAAGSAAGMAKAA